MAVKFIYTDTEVQEITAKYQAGVALDVLADEYNKSVPSVRMKLVKLGVYQKAVKPAATPKTPTTTVVAKKPSTSKAAMLEDFQRAHAMVGDALW